MSKQTRNDCVRISLPPPTRDEGEGRAGQNGECVATDEEREEREGVAAPHLTPSGLSLLYHSCPMSVMTRAMRGDGRGMFRERAGSQA